MSEILQGVAGFLLLMGLWIGVQAILRRGYAAPAGQDMLEDLAHGCGACGGGCGTSCARSRKESHESR
jgi:hypothetical protein